MGLIQIRDVPDDVHRTLKARAAARGVTLSDYLRFADDLIPGHGGQILAGWKALAGHDADEMGGAADALARAADAGPAGGPLKGLLFGSPERFLTDLVLMLRQRAATEHFASAVNAGRNARESLARLVAATGRWQQRHGYECNWYDPVMRPALRKLNAPAINEVLSFTYEAKPPYGPGRTPEVQIRANFRTVESFTPRLLAAMKKTADEMR